MCSAAPEEEVVLWLAHTGAKEGRELYLPNIIGHCPHDTTEISGLYIYLQGLRGRPGILLHFAGVPWALFFNVL